MLCLLVPLAAAAPAALDPVEARLSPRLREAAARAARGELEDFRAAQPAPPLQDGLSVVVEGDEQLRVALAEAGFSVEAAAGGLVQVFAPYERLYELAAAPGVRRAREPWYARPKAETEGREAVLAAAWDRAGLDGAGVKIAVVDVGFARFDTVGEGDTPRERIEDFSRGNVEATNHGTAVTEVIHDFAPGATYYLATIATEVDLAEVLEWLVEEEVDVVNASIGFDNVAHADGESFVTRAVDAAVASGLVYVAAAGNENDKYRVGALALGEGGVVTLAGAPATRVWTSGGYAQVSLRWSEPFGRAATDLDLVLYNEDGSECGRAEAPQAGADDPYEIVIAAGCSELVTAVVTSPEGVDPVGLEGYLYAPWSIEEADWTNTEDLTLPGDTRRGISVGAWYADEGALPGYSSRGPTNDGRLKPDIVAPTGVTTATYGTGRFEGSSAAAPHVAGLVALWMQATGWRREPEAARQWVLTEAQDLGISGPDFETGAGLARAVEVPKGRCGCATTPVPVPVGAPLLALLPWAWARARRRP